MKMTLSVVIGLCAMWLTGCEPTSVPEAQQARLDTAKPIPQEVWGPISFDPNDLKTNDTSLFFSEFSIAVGKSEKGKYETSEEYKKRMLDLDSAIKPFSAKTEYAFTPEYAEMIYNADTKSFELRNSLFCQKGWPIDEGVSCGMGHTTDKSEQYVGQNGFGAKAEVTSESGRDFYFVFQPSNLKGQQFRDSNGEYRIPITCPVPIDKAKLLDGKKVVGAIVVNLREAKALSGYTRIEDATVASPYAQRFEPIGIPALFDKSVCFVQDTGEILHISE